MRKLAERKKKPQERLDPRKCLEDFYAMDPYIETMAPYLERTENTTETLFKRFAKEELNFSTEEANKCWDPSSLDKSLHNLGHVALLYTYLRMQGLDSERKLKDRLLKEHKNFSAHLPEYIRMLPTKHPEKLRNLAWAVKKCKQKELKGSLLCTKIRQYHKNPWFSQLHEGL